MRSLWLFSLLSLIIAVPLAQAQTMSAPEVYYYSPPENGFVIEQANGTHSAVMGRGIVPDEQRTLGREHD